MGFEYSELLKTAKKKLPLLSERPSSRFEIPNVRGHIQGNKTVISNFSQIVSSLQRPPEHLMKYLLKELATPGECRGGLLILGTKVHSSAINEKINKYAEEFVICKTCGKPDTSLVNEQGLLFMRCQACGAKKAVRSKI